jgi:hypothetical protein
MKIQTIAILALCQSCTPAQLDRAKAATDAREYACRYLELTTEPELAEARKRCQQGAELAEVLAVAAGPEACRAAHGAGE